MKKLKTRQAASKRFHKTPNKKFIRKKAYKSHLLEKKNSKQKRRLSLYSTASPGETKSIRKMLPHA